MRNRKEKMIMLVLVLASAFVAIGSGVGVYCIGRKTAEVRAANDVLHGRITAARNKINKLQAMRLEREEAQARLEVAESILPNQKEIETLVDSLSEFARKSGVVIEKAQPVRQVTIRAAKGAVKRFDQADFDLDLSGDFFQFVEFLNYLENYKRFIRVDSFAVTAGRNEGEPHSVGLKFATFTYVDAVAAAPDRSTVVKGAAK